MGISTGLLAAAAVALSPSVSTLIPLAVQLTLIGFRLGLLVQKAARNLQIPNGPAENAVWTYALRDITEIAAESLLRSFHLEKVTQCAEFHDLVY